MDPPTSGPRDKQPQDKGPPNLPRAISEANLAMVNNLKEEIRSRVVGVSGKPHTVKDLTNTTVQLPELRKLPPDFQRMLKEALFDQDMKETLKRAKALNWCRTIRHLYPLRTMGDGNCLLHAVSLAMWGIEDSCMLLRRLLYVALVEDEEHGEIKKRWHKDRRRLNEAQPDFMVHFNTREWEQEWEMVVKAAEDLRRDNTSESPNYGDLQYECLEEIHIFVLANVLKRPIIVVGDSVIRGITGASLAPNNFRGTYLPLLWKPDECIKTPIVLAYCNNHFAPLVSFRDSEDLAENACPLVTSELEPFHVHFLVPHEESVVHRILQSYLHITELTYTRPDGLAMVLAAKLTYTPIPERLDLMKHYMYFAEKQYREYVRYKSSGGRDPHATQAKSPASPYKEVKRDLGDLHLSVTVSGEEDQEVRRQEPGGSSLSAGHVGHEQGSLADTRQAHLCSVCGTGPANQRYGGQCSQCYGSMVGEHGAVPAPSAPTQSLITNLPPSPSLLETYSWRRETPPAPATEPIQEPVPEPLPEPMIEGMSMVNQLCAYPKCSNLSSLKTYPYCHIHASHKSRRPQSTPRVGTAAGQTLTRPHTLETQESERHSFDEASFHQVGRGHPCVEPGCDMYGLPEWEHRCSYHHARVQGKSTSPKATESWQPCRNTGCKSHGKAGYTGYCSTCFTNKPPQTAKPVKVPSTESPSSSLSASTVSSTTSFERLRHETRLCIGPNCSNPGLDTYNGLCEECYTTILQRTAAQGSGVPRRKIRVSSQDYEEELTPPGLQCSRPGCDMFGSPEFMGLCSQCWRAQHQASKGAVQIGSGMLHVVKQPTPAPAVEYRVTTGIPVPMVHKCRSPKCRGLGELAYGGYCQGCHRLTSAMATSVPHQHHPHPTNTQPKSFSAPIMPTEPQAPETTEEGYKAAMRRLEGSMRSSVRHCKTTGCKNFGNPKSQGFCNTCYKQLQESHPHHCCGRYNRGTGWDECDYDGANN